MMKHVARARAGPAGNEAGPTVARWKTVRDRVIPRLPLNDAQRQALVVYVEQNWVDVKDDCFWMRAWCDYKHDTDGKRHVLRHNNYGPPTP